MALLTVCTGTPTIRVRDNRGQAVRTLRYNRNVAGGVATQCIERNTFNDLGQPSSSQDARFFAQGGNSPTLNFQHTPALSGQVLQTVSADAGTTQTFHDIAGRPIWQRDARGTVQTFTYDALGRPLTRSEQVEGTGPTYVRERWTYGDALLPGGSYDATDTTDPRNLNLRGQVVQHYDTAGLLDHGARGCTVQGPVQQEVRTLAQDPQAEIDWNAAGLATHWPGVLDPTSYPTSWQYNALGQVLAQTDAAGHQRNSTYDLAGRLFGSTVTLKGGSPQSIVRTQTYNAAGQLLVKQAGTGVTTTHTYEPRLTQRLLTIKTTRDSDRATLQSKQYTYDPVGNVTVLQDPLSQPQYFKGQAISPDKTYTYDARYQLIQATGRQNATGTPTDTGTPAGILFPSDPINLQSYTRSYTYDLGGNLTGVNLNGAGANRKVIVAPNSNRALSNANLPTLAPGDVDTYFDAAGNAACLDGNSLQPLTWNGLNQLQSVTFVYRHDQNPDENDREYYIYGGDGQRVRKTRYAKVGAAYSQQQDDVIYLPGLELRRQGATKTLEVLVLDDGARLLRWTAGAPAGIANPQLRLAIQDRLGSCSLELNTAGQLITQEEYFPFGGTAVLAAATQSDVDNKTIRYSGKERDASGLYYYGFRYYQPWIGRWVSPDPAGTVDGLNLYGMVKNNPASLHDHAGLVGEDGNRKRKIGTRDGSDTDLDLGKRAAMIPSPAAHQHHASAQQGAVQAPPAGTSDAAPAANHSVAKPSARLRTEFNKPRLIEVYDHFKTNGLIKQEQNEVQRYFIDMHTRDARLAAYLPDEKSMDGGTRIVKTRGKEYPTLDMRIRDRLASLGFLSDGKRGKWDYRFYLRLPTGMTLDTYREEIVPLLGFNKSPSGHANLFENVIKWWQENPFEREALAREATKHFLEKRAARPYSQTAADQHKENMSSAKRARLTAATAPAGAIPPGSQGNKAAPSAALQPSGSGLKAVSAPAARPLGVVGPQARQSPVASTSAASHLAPSPQQQAPAEFSREWFEGIPLTPPAANVPQHLMHAYGTPQAFAQQFHAVPQGSFNNPPQAYYGGLPIPQQQQHPAALAYGHQGPSPYIVNAQNVTINYHHGGAPAPFAPLMAAPDPTRMYDPGPVYPGQQMQNWPGQMMAPQAPMHAGYLPAPAPQADPSELPEDLAGIDLADLYQVGTHLSYRDYR